MKFSSFYVFFLCIAGAICALHAAETTIHLTHDVGGLIPGNQIAFYEDTTNTLSIYDLLHTVSPEAFTPNEQAVPNLGFRDQPLWGRIDFEKEKDSQRDWIVDIALPSLHNVSFFIVQNDSVLQEHRTGFMVPLKERKLPFRNPALKIPRTISGAFSVYARIHSETPLLLPFSIKEYDNYIRYQFIIEFLLGFYFGALFIMAVYHFYLYLSLRDTSYLLIVLFIVTFALGQMTAVYGFLAEWGVTDIPRYIRLLHLINFASAFFGMAFSRDVVGSKEFAPRIDRIIRLNLVVAALLFFISPLLRFSTAEKALVILNISPLPFLILASIKALRKGYRPAGYYLIATLSFVAGLVTYNLMYGFDAIPFNTFFYFIANISILIMLALLSLGLADKFKLMQQERERAQTLSMEHLHKALVAEKEKSKIEHDLEHARKMETVGRLLGGVAHDIRNFMSPILGFSQLIKKKSKAVQDIAGYADSLADATRRLRDLTSKLVNVSRKKPLTQSLISVNAVLEQVFSLITHSAPSGVSIQKNITPHISPIMGDESMIQSAFLNICMNAIDAMPEGGTLTVDTAITTIGPNDTLAKQFNNPGGTFVQISISDTGTGMDTETVEHIFEPFFTTKSEGKGTGLGLAGVYNCVKVHKGLITVQTHVGKGTTFIMYYPVSTSSESAVEELENVVAIENRHIMVVDDDALVCRVVKAILEEEHAVVHTYTSATNALTYYKGHSSEIDVILLDMKMPEIDGRSCFDAIREINKNAPVVIMTAQASEKSILYLKQQKDVFFLYKPFEMSKLTKMLSSVVTRAYP